MGTRSLLVAPVLAACAVSGLLAQPDPEIERVRDLVRAGALPRKALAEAESSQTERRYREILRRTLLSETLEESEIDTMLDAARGLERVVRQRFDRVMMQVEAGVAPAKLLVEAQEDYRAAKRQAELAESRANLVRQMERMVASQTYLEELEAADEVETFRFFGFADYEYEVLTEIADMYRSAFGSDPPVSAEGETDFHRSIGLDHTGRIDVAVHPDSDEGEFLMYMLENLGIPYIAFRTAIPGQSSGPHIHIGPPSERIGERQFAEIP